MKTDTHLCEMVLGQLKHAKVHVGGGVEAATADENYWTVGTVMCL